MINNSKCGASVTVSPALKFYNKILSLQKVFEDVHEEDLDVREIEGAHGIRP